MISNADEYRFAQEEIDQLTDWLKRLNREHPLPEKGLTRAGIRKKISQIHQELAEYEGTVELDTVEST